MRRVLPLYACTRYEAVLYQVFVQSSRKIFCRPIYTHVCNTNFLQAPSLSSLLRSRATHAAGTPHAPVPPLRCAPSFSSTYTAQNSLDSPRCFVTFGFVEIWAHRMHAYRSPSEASRKECQAKLLYIEREFCCALVFPDGVSERYVGCRVFARFVGSGSGRACSQDLVEHAWWGLIFCDSGGGAPTSICFLQQQGTMLT